MVGVCERCSMAVALKAQGRRPGPRSRRAYLVGPSKWLMRVFHIPRASIQSLGLSIFLPMSRLTPSSSVNEVIWSSPGCF